MRECRLCKKHIPVKAEIDGKIRNLQRRKYCLDCSPFGSGNRKKLEDYDGKDYKEERKKRDKEKYRKWQRKARRERKVKLVNMLGGKCRNCGYDKCYAALEFHHEDEKLEKSFGIAANGMLASWEKLLEEVEKCILLCCRCHREEHHLDKELKEKWVDKP